MTTPNILGGSPAYDPIQQEPVPGQGYDQTMTDTPPPETAGDRANFAQVTTEDGALPGVIPGKRPWGRNNNRQAIQNKKLKSELSSKRDEEAFATSQTLPLIMQDVETTHAQYLHWQSKADEFMQALQTQQAPVMQQDAHANTGELIAGGLAALLGGPQGATAGANFAYDSAKQRNALNFDRDNRQFALNRENAQIGLQNATSQAGYARQLEAALHGQYTGRVGEVEDRDTAWRRHMGEVSQNRQWETLDNKTKMEFQKEIINLQDRLQINAEDRHNRDVISGENRNEARQLRVGAMNKLFEAVGSDEFDGTLKFLKENAAPGSDIVLSPALETYLRNAAEDRKKHRDDATNYGKAMEMARLGLSVNQQAAQGALGAGGIQLPSPNGTDPLQIIPTPEAVESGKAAIAAKQAKAGKPLDHVQNPPSQGLKGEALTAYTSLVKAVSTLDALRDGSAKVAPRERRKQMAEAEKKVRESRAALSNLAPPEWTAERQRVRDIYLNAYKQAKANNPNNVAKVNEMMQMARKEFRRKYGEDL